METFNKLEVQLRIYMTYHIVDMEPQLVFAGCVATISPSH